MFIVNKARMSSREVFDFIGDIGLSKVPEERIEIKNEAGSTVYISENGKVAYFNNDFLFTLICEGLSGIIDAML